MFDFSNVGRWGFKGLSARNDNEREISLFDVKDLYDRAYEEKAKALAALEASKELMAQAEGLDAAYRALLETKAPYVQRFPWRVAS